MKRIKAMLSDRLKNLKLRQRMSAVYAIGCFVPLFFAFIYLYKNSSNRLAQQITATQMTKLQAQRDVLDSAMDLAVELSERFYFNLQRDKLVLRRYAGENNLEVSYKDFDQLETFIQNYYSDIRKVNIYLEPGITKMDNRHFKLITDKIKEKKWYRNTVAVGAKPHWSYLTDVQTGQRSLRLTRTLYDNSGKKLGILSISLDPGLSEDYIFEQDGYALMMLNDNEMVYNNAKMTEDEINYIISQTGKDEFGGDVTFRNESCITSKINISSRYSDDYFSIIILRSDPELAGYANYTAMMTLFPLLMAGIIMAIAIVLVNSWFTKRIRALNHAMKSAISRQYDVNDSEIGATKDEIWEVYNDLYKMIQDMQKLDKAAAEERLQRERMYSRQKDVEFKMLTTQINPHFLYNTLENIRMLARIHNEKDIEEMSVRLTRLLRSSLEAGKELRSLEWEMDKIECYIAIQDFRFGDRIHAEVSYDKENADKIMVIPLVIQPFVENAYVHAMEDMEEGGEIRVHAEVDKDIRITIEDNGCGMSEEKLKALNENLNDFENMDRTHIGVANVNQRIKLRFGDEYGVTVESVEGKGTKVQLKMPAVKHQ